MEILKITRYTIQLPTSLATSDCVDSVCLKYKKGKGAT